MNCQSVRMFANLLLSCLVFSAVATAELESNQELSHTVKFLQEQVQALLKHRQEDYNALEESLKQSMEKNTELLILRDEVKQMRKELSLTHGGSSNEAKNERLRVRWLGSAVTELQNELAEMLKARNASEELAERARMRSEIALLRGDIAEVGRGVRDLGGRITRLEAALGTVRVDISATKERASQLSRTCADVSSQLSTVQMELKNSKYDSESTHKHRTNSELLYKSLDHPLHHMRHSSSRSMFRRVDERLANLERKISIVSKKRSMIEKRVVFEDQKFMEKRLSDLENIDKDLNKKLFNMSHEISNMRQLEETIIQILESNQKLDLKLDNFQSENKREFSRLDVNAARKAAELSLTREELGNLKKAVQALSVSASKLQEKSDQQQEAMSRMNSSLVGLDLSKSMDKVMNMTKELEHVEDQYRSMVDALPGNCDERDGLTLLAPGPGAPLLASCRKGWIVVGRRTDGTVDFDRTWNEYATGFGSPVNEFWAGNEALHKLSRDNCTKLKIEMTDIYGTYYIANYDYFYVGSEETGYRLQVSGYSGNASDALSYQNNMAFSAKDRDLDISATNCADNYHGGWWFSHCQHANLNGKYSLGLAWYQAEKNEWVAVMTSEIAVQKREDCDY